ncbi:MAG: HAMP domain-containing histidine kinase [Propionibacteriaceae bacterium]|nr:HAMP domain-containing histidine kinase [Propionibacteriaceae bacterium]
MTRRIRDSVGAKTFWWLFAAIGACCILVYTLTIVFLPRLYHGELDRQFSADFDQIIQQLTQDSPEQLSAQLVAFAMNNQASVTIMNADHDVIYHVNSSQISLSANGQPSQQIDPETPQRALARQYDFHGEQHTISATAQLTPVTQTYRLLMRLIPGVLVIIVAVSAISAWLASRHFSKPLEELTVAATRLENMDMTWSYDSPRTDEIGRLAASLATMSTRLAETVDGLRRANEQLLHDVDHERELERQRVELFTSVSHELKTPLTILKGELEAMLYQIGDDRDRDTYLSHALRTTSDMERIIKDVLAVANMSAPDFRLRRVEVDLTAIIADICRSLAGMADDRSIRLAADLADNIRVDGDPRLLDQAFTNIVTNAVTYSPVGAQVRVVLTEHDLTVDNSGVEIDPGDLDQVFLPFFRADKSRNRNTGGSGLGLSIVANIFDHHGIAYTLDNTEDGVRFTARF